MKKFGAVILMALLASCGTYREVKVREVGEHSFITFKNDTVQAKKRVLYNLEVDSTYGGYFRKNGSFNIVSKK